jgi:hypothetical protein
MSMPQFRAVAPFAIIIVLATGCAAPAMRAKMANYLPPVPQTTKATNVFQKDYGERGRLVVKMSEAYEGTEWRDIEYAFLLMPAGGGATVELASTGFSDHNPFGSGEPADALIEAALTPDPAVAAVYLTQWKVGGKVERAHGIGYRAEVIALESSGIAVPSEAQTAVQSVDKDEPPRTASVAGSLKDGNLTLSLKGPKDTLSFGFELSEKHFGWYSLPPAAAKPGAANSKMFSLL